MAAEPHTNPAEINQQIEQERENIRKRGKELGEIKDAFLDKGGNVPPNLTLNLFLLLKDIIQHDMNRKINLSPEQRKANLSNIVITVHLLLGIMQLSTYDNPKLGYEGRNIWRMLKFLVKFNLGLHIPNLAAPIYNISDGEIVNILENDVAAHLLPIVDAEINAIQPPSPPSVSGLFHPIDYTAARNAIRNQYRNHTLLVSLNLIVIKAKEMEQIDKAIAAINGINSCAPLLANQNPNIVNITKKAILHYLVTIGEAVTKKNITPQTASLVQANFVASGIRKLLINLANKITHNEWDISLNNIENCLTNTNFQDIINEMPFLLAIFTDLKNQLSQIIHDNRQAQHYQQTAPASSATPFPNNTLTTLHNLLSGTSNMYNQQKITCPDAFTTRAMLESIRSEGNDLRLINSYGERGLIPEEISLNALRYQLSRIAKFLQEIEGNGDLQIEVVLENNLAEQYRVFRNYMRHGEDMMDTINRTMERNFLIRYAKLIIEHIYPTLEGKFLSTQPSI